MVDIVQASVTNPVASSTLMTIFWIILGLFFLFIVGLIIYLLWINAKYKYFVVVRSLSRGRKLIFRDKAREWKDEDGVKYWKLQKLKHLMTVPPPEAIEITTKGKIFVEVYKTENDQYYYLRDDNAFDPNNATLAPITTNQRAALANQIRKKYNRQLHKWTEYIPAIASGLVIVIILIVVFAFWKDITKPSVEVANALAGVSKSQAETADLLKQIIQKEQILRNASLPTNPVHSIVPLNNPPN